LAEHLGRQGVRVVDCRYRVDGSARQLHAEGHIPGAAFLDWANELVDRDQAVPFQLAGPEAVARALGSAGVGDGMTAVLYDDTASLYAGRVWWSLQVYGFESVRVLDGGWVAWRSSGRPISTAASASPEPATFTPRMEPSRVLSTGDVRALLGSRDVDLVDVRAPAEYRGQGGTATLLTVPGDQTFQDAETCGRLFANAGVQRGRRVVTYDGSGIAAAKAAFVLGLLGYPDVAVYDAGWSDWGARPDLPVDR